MWAAPAARRAPPRSWIYSREARLLARFERRAALHAFVTTLTTDRERQTLRANAPQARLEVIENGIDFASLTPPAPPTADAGVVFCGVLDYQPNVEGIIWFCRDVWPHVREARPDARLQVVGANPSPAVRRLHQPALGIDVVGPVADVKPYLWKAAASVAPLHTARGVQNKVLEAVAAGLPTVATSVVMQGLPREVRAACDEGNDAESFATAVLQLLSLAPEARRARAARANLEPLSWPRRLAPLRALLEAAAAQKSE
jgi:glycosyltransferase involved in cell wall biosynthesis